MQNKFNKTNNEYQLNATYYSFYQKPNLCANELLPNYVFRKKNYWPPVSMEIKII